ncbi:hypothetical protein HQ590_04735 [bacterium]|nr:hypothetical protein [bacterium]
MKRHLWLSVLLLAGGLAAARAADPSFESHWRDGRAELDGYRLSVSRYGQPREATAALIYVTEPFSRSRRVKLDHPERDPEDAVEVLKLNLVRRFQTGIYDYHTMVSAFFRTDDFRPLKVTFSSAEWCGHVFERLLFFPRRVTATYQSYFQGETGHRQVGHPRNGLTEDALWVVLRGLRGDFLRPGQQQTVPFLPGPYPRRLAHQPLAWTEATITRSLTTAELSVPAGTFAASTYDIRLANGRTGQFWVEAAYPHRILRWELEPDLRADLTGTQRLPYWRHHQNGDERFLEELGLPAR